MLLMLLLSYTLEVYPAGMDAPPRVEPSPHIPVTTVSNVQGMGEAEFDKLISTPPPPIPPIIVASAMLEAGDLSDNLS